MCPRTPLTRVIRVMYYTHFGATRVDDFFPELREEPRDFSGRNGHTGFGAIVGLEPDGGGVFD